MGESMEPSKERELKFGPVDHDALRERFTALEAESQGPTNLEDNWVFDAQGKLKDSGQVLRLRKDRNGSHLTFKGPASFEDRVKVRTEYETGIEDIESMRRILEALGYTLRQRYQKYREVWILGSVVISLDHTPIGDFVEFEGEGCETVAARSGLDPANAERRNYLRLYEDYLKEHPEAPPNMVFS